MRLPEYTLPHFPAGYRPAHRPAALLQRIPPVKKKILWAAIRVCSLSQIYALPSDMWLLHFAQALLLLPNAQTRQARESCFFLFRQGEQQRQRQVHRLCSKAKRCVCVCMQNTAHWIGRAHLHHFFGKLFIRGFRQILFPDNQRLWA